MDSQYFMKICGAVYLIYPIQNIFPINMMTALGGDGTHWVRFRFVTTLSNYESDLDSRSPCCH